MFILPCSFIRVILAIWGNGAYRKNVLTGSVDDG